MCYPTPRGALASAVSHAWQRASVSHRQRVCYPTPRGDLASEVSHAGLDVLSGAFVDSRHAPFGAGDYKYPPFMAGDHLLSIAPHSRACTYLCKSAYIKMNLTHRAKYPYLNN